MRSCSILCLVLVWVGISAAQVTIFDTNFSSGPQYLVTSGSPLFARSIATPTLSLSETPLANNLAAPTAASPAELPASVAAQNQIDLTRVYWGTPETSEPTVQNSSVIEITASEPPRNLPASIIDVGVEQTTDAQELRGRGLGVTVGEAASFWKKHKVAAAHLYTNRDIERLHGG